jgi:hypothetical protein
MKKYDLSTLLKKAQDGDKIYQTALGQLYLYGSNAKYTSDNIKIDYKEAHKWLTLAAQQNYPYAQFYLAEVYNFGLGVNKDLTQAFKWVELAAKGGFNGAQNNLAYCYEYGLGVDKNLEKAKSWYQISFKNGHQEAYLGIKDIDKIEVKNEENYTAIKKVIKLLNQTSPNTKSHFVIKPKKYIDQKYKEAFDLTYKIANSSKPIWFSYILLASMYLNGVGVTKSWRNAYQWLFHAYEDLSDLIRYDPFSIINKFEDKLQKQIKRKKISVGTYIIKSRNFEDSFFQNITLLNSIWGAGKKNINAIELILRQSMLLCPEKSVQIEAFTNYENGKQVLFTQQRLNVPPIIAKRGPYYENLEGEAEAAGFYESFYESTGGFGGMTDSEKDMF